MGEIGRGSEGERGRKELGGGEVDLGEGERGLVAREELSKEASNIFCI